MDGLELARHIAREPRAARTTTILVSPPTADFLLGANLLECGVALVISKPFQRAAVFAALRRVAAGAASSAPPASDRVPPAFTLDGRKVLLVQDSEVTRELVKQLLESAGAFVETAGDGVEAVELATAGTFDVVLMDLHLPILDGWTAARLLRDEPRTARVPILGLTASALPRDRQRCLAAGMRACLRTPIDAAELIGAVAGCVGAPDLWQPTRPSRPSRIAWTDPPASRGSGPTRASLVAGSELEVTLAVQRLGGDAALYRRLLRRFAATHQSTAREVRRALDEGKIESATLTVHATVSAAANIGAARLHRHSQALESALRRSPTPSVADLLLDFEHAHARCLAAASAMLEGHSLPPRASAWPRQGELVSTLESLRTLLEDHDTAAIDHLQTLSDLLADRPSSAPNLHLLEASIGAYDFVQTRRHLESFTEWLTHRALVSRAVEEAP